MCHRDTTSQQVKTTNQLAAASGQGVYQISLDSTSTSTRSAAAAGGLHVRICVHRELVPGPELREMLDRLQAEVRQGLLETQRPHEYYLARLDELYGAVAPSEVRWEAES